MAEADTSNAHIRPASRRGRRKQTEARRDSNEVAASEAQRLQQDPAYIKGVELVRSGLVHELEHLQHNGTAEDDAFERECCRALRTLKSVTRAIAVAAQLDKFNAREELTSGSERKTD